MSNKNKQHASGGDTALMSHDTSGEDRTAEGKRTAGGEASTKSGIGKGGTFAEGKRTAGGEASTKSGIGKGGTSAEGARSARGGNSTKGAHSADSARPSRSGKGRKRLIVSLSVLAGVLVIAVAAAFIAISQIAVPITAEVGQEVDLSRFTEGFAGVICRVEYSGHTVVDSGASAEGGTTVYSIPSDGSGPSAGSVPTDKIGEQSLDLIFFGFIRRSVPVLVQDTVAPELEVRNVSVASGLSVTPEDFVVSARDLTSLTFRFSEPLGDLDTRVERDVVIIAADEGGNETSKTAHFSCGDDALSAQAQLGVTTEADILAAFNALCPWVVGIDLGEVDLTTPGNYTVSAKGDGSDGIAGESGRNTAYLLCVTVSDTIAPSATVHSMDLRLGESVSDEDIVSDIEDHSSVTVTVGEKTLDKAGLFTVPVTLEDAAGNRTDLEANLYVHDIPEAVEIERGASEADLLALLTNGDTALSLVPGFSMSSLSLGQNNVTLRGAYNDLTSVVTVRDTTPPVLTLKDVTVIANRGVSPGDFVVSCTDASAVSFSFEGNVSAMNAGVSKITVAATDEAGNVTKAQATLTVIVDTVAPVIHGVRDITVELGAKVSFSGGVYAVDDIDGNVSVNVDSSAVNTSVAGSYTVYYTANDRAGNTAKASATVTVSPVNLNTVYTMADNILAQITNPKMTDRQKAWAIYSWCTANIRYSTSTSYLMGNFVQGAYSGFRTRAGNCYIYYAVASCMLTRSGIENIEISRNDPTNPHYWNLVKIDGSWYHFDSCPHFRGAPLTAFLLTDAEVAAYSASSAPGYYSFDKSKYPRTP